MKEGGHLRLFNYLETSGKSDEGLHDMIYFAFSKMTALGTITITRSDLVRAVRGGRDATLSSVCLISVP